MKDKTPGLPTKLENLIQVSTNSVEPPKRKFKQFETGKMMEVANRKSAELLKTRVALRTLQESQGISLTKYLRSQGRAVQIMKRHGRNNQERGVRGALMSVTDADDQVQQALGQCGARKGQGGQGVSKSWRC